LGIAVTAIVHLCACGGTTADAQAFHIGLEESGGDLDAQLCWVVQEMDGYVNNWGKADISSDAIRVGYQPGWFGGKDNRGILTFDTSNIPADAEIQGVWMYLGIHQNHRSLLPYDWSSYLSEYMVIDVAGPGGFGGFPCLESLEVTGFDYYASAATRTGWVQDPAVGAVHLYNPDLNPSDVYQHLNREGLTQIRLSLEANPLYYLIEFQSGEIESNGPEEPYPQPFLYVIWRALPAE
jgi:hypothetical protein